MTEEIEKLDYFKPQSLGSAEIIYLCEHIRETRQKLNETIEVINDIMRELSCHK